MKLRAVHAAKLQKKKSFAGRGLSVAMRGAKTVGVRRFLLALGCEEGVTVTRRALEYDTAPCRFQDSGHFTMSSCAFSVSGKGEKKTLEVDVPWLLTGT